ncbi:DUF2059 domain-containing protein [Psychroflexus aestuariivivens]|uniref:DUF2059 domain-containing protein n=1 Tax=Psychroflexus aestuariivivens TaxID=1795040 RepID=UPI000FD941C6|nr:DUF2059 domain-containing protein [Psychroflexus aestuariivivens]
MKKVFLFGVALCISAITFAQDSQELKDAKRLVKLSNNSVESALEPIYTTIPEDKVADFKKEIQPALDAMYNKFAQVYTEKFTAKEIQDLLDFYETDLGKKMLKVQGEVMELSMEEGQKFSTKIMPIYQKYSGY